MLTGRQTKLLRLIIESYIKEARPIASEYLVKKGRDKISSATVRNDMAELEKAGYIEQPHTSAGRAPTIKAYEWFARNAVIRDGILKRGFDYAQPDKVQDDNEKGVPRLFEKRKFANQREKIKKVAKWLAAESGLAVIAGFGENDNYYTGLSGLFSQPEFCEQAAIVNVSALIEKFDIIVEEIYPNVSSEPGILVGRKGQFGKMCSFVAAKAGTVLIGILGPIRMDYKKNYQLIKAAVKLIVE